jgi:hypothetical protein
VRRWPLVSLQGVFLFAPQVGHGTTNISRTLSALGVRVTNDGPVRDAPVLRDEAIHALCELPVRLVRNSNHV